ncbi:hypothetical protein L2E82_05090 [Cichorium intybus]|uniref:Uncharacterized protein n=1 Tax=Cichorium intybus TaxID=13427 RepID=A0ACB9H6K5_CICIN|nr:hypothetical protein L2E82_05090 [Cichorium intybus]
MKLSQVTTVTAPIYFYNLTTPFRHCSLLPPPKSQRSLSSGEHRSLSEKQTHTRFFRLFFSVLSTEYNL